MLTHLKIFFGCTIVATALSAADSAPNILLILPDQMRASAMGCDGNVDVISPTIDQLASEGVLFERTYANVPVCCPARAILLTGTYPHVNGMVANDLRLHEDQVTLAEILQEKGYRTGFVGKWHLDGGPREPGFVPPGPRRQGFEFWAAYQCHHRHFEPDYFRDDPERIVVPKFEPEASCDFAEEFLRSQPLDQPFFLTVQMGPPHDPYGAPPEYMQLYDVEKLTMPVAWRAGSETRPTPKAGLRRGPLVNRFVPVGGREELAAYYAAITAIDDQVKRLLAVLKERGLDENTILLFTSDHGDMLGSHGLRRKRKPYDESARVPGILRWPAKIPAGRRTQVLFSHVDMAPTLLALAGLPVPEWMQGADLSGVALGKPDGEAPKAVLLQQFTPYTPDQVAFPWRGIVTADHTYARSAEGAWLLFDHQKDPHQLQNLADREEAKTVQAKLDEQLAQLMNDTGDSWDHNAPDITEEGGILYKDQTFYTLDEYRAWKQNQPAP